jgi:hypothetical protein
MPPSVPPSSLGALRERLQPWGGLTTISVVVVAILFLGFMAWQGRPRSVSSEELQGVEVAIGPATHVNDGSALTIPEGDPPVGGPHFPTPLRAAKYDEPVQDGNAIHSLEHGMIWISYNESASPQEIEQLADIQSDHSRDVLLSPRSQNTAKISVASWGRLLRLDGVDRAAIERFIEVNRDRSPEPGVR